MPRINDGGKCYDPPKDARLCHKHFLPSDYEEKHQSRNSTHRNSNGGIMQRGVLKPNTVPSVWPGCPEHLSKRTIERPAKMATSTAREENDSRIRKNLIEMQTLQDAFNSLDELDANIHLYFFFYLLTY